MRVGGRGYKGVLGVAGETSGGDEECLQLQVQVRVVKRRACSCRCRCGW